MKRKEFNKYRKNKNSRIDFDELIFSEKCSCYGNPIRQLKIYKFKDGKIGFIDTLGSQGNFILKPKEVRELISFLKIKMQKE